MKKVFILLMLCLLLTSCASLSQNEKNSKYTEEEALFAVKLAAVTSEENASNAFYNQIFSQDTFVPEQYSILESMKKEIPGMTRTLNDFRSYFSSLILDNINELFDFTESKMAKLNIDYPQFYVISSNTSISDYFISLYNKDIRAIVNKIIDNADYSLFKSAIASYNSYINVKSIQKEKLYEADFDTLFTEYICENYFETLRKSEELFRTTPSPYSDSTFKKVFGNY